MPRGRRHCKQLAGGPGIIIRVSGGVGEGWLLEDERTRRIPVWGRHLPRSLGAEWEQLVVVI